MEKKKNISFLLFKYFFHKLMVDVMQAVKWMQAVTEVTWPLKPILWNSNIIEIF